MKCPKCQFENPDTVHYCGECGTQLIPKEEIPVTETLETPTEELTRGTTFANRYEIIEELGKGGMGKVYRVEDKKIKEEVALKLIKPEIASDKKTLERFSNELKLARKISHKNVGRMYELMEEKGTRYITMEYVPGEDLKRLIRRVKQLTVGTAVTIAKQVCEGLTEAHRLGVVHRDLKPQNVMVDEEGNARILDFGIARSLKTKGITGAGVMVGTPEYMSPEQAEVKEVDQRSDIYSLGVILYEMATGRVPFEGETPLGIAMKHKSEMPKDPRELNAQIPEDLSRVILRCMEKDKEKRYQSAGEVRSELENIEKGIPTTDRVIPKRKPITSREITVTFGLKKLFIPALVVVALVITAVVIWQPWSQKEAIPIPSDEPSLAVLYFENNSGDESLDNWRDALPTMLTTDLQQSKYVQVIGVDRIYGALDRLDLLEAEKYSTDDIKKVASEVGVSHVVFGSFITAGNKFIIHASLIEVSNPAVVTPLKTDGIGEESITDSVDYLTRQIKMGLDISQKKILDDIDERIGRISTNSPEAFKYYNEGYKYHFQGDIRKSIQLLERAVAVDPMFASAYALLANEYRLLGYEDKRKEFYQKAFELSNRVSDRERYNIQARFYREVENNYDKAIEASKKLLDIYPEDISGNHALGFIYLNLEEWDKAIECYEINLKKKVDHHSSYWYQSQGYSAKGLYDKAKEAVDYYKSNFSVTTPWLLIRKAENYLGQGEYDLALIEANKAFFLNPALYYNHECIGDIYYLKLDLTAAEKEYQKLLDFEEPGANLNARERLGLLYLLQGRFEESKSQFNQGIKLAQQINWKAWQSYFYLNLAYIYQRTGNPEEALKESSKAWNNAITVETAQGTGSKKNALHFKGLAQVEMKTLNAAQKSANELKELCLKAMNKKLIRKYYHFMGMIELKRENFSRAIEYFKEAIALLPFQYSQDNAHALFIDPLALAYYKSGDFYSAQEEYIKITKLTTGRLRHGDIYAKSFYMLGKIHEQQKKKKEAIEYYQKFLDLWKDADPGIAEVGDAKKRLAGLKKQ